MSLQLSLIFAESFCPMAADMTGINDFPIAIVGIKAMLMNRKE